MRNPIDTTLQALESHGCNLTRDGSGWRTSCPSPNHPNGNRRNPALTISEASDGAALLKCHAGCDVKDVLAAIGLEPRDLFPPRDFQHASKAERPVNRLPGLPPGKDGVDRFPYKTADGDAVIYVCRIESGDPDPETGKRRKTFRQYSRDEHGWIAGLGKWKGQKRPLFRLPVILGEPGLPVVFHEGEKAVIAASKARLHGVHTTCIGGAGNAKHSDFSPLRGRDVCIVPDNDGAGEKHAHDVAKLAHEAGARSIRMLRLPNLPPKGDCVEWIEAGGTPEAWQKLIAEAEVCAFHTTQQNKQNQQNPGEWPEIVPLDRVEHPAPLDMRLMPDCLAEVVGNVAEAIQAPRELAWGVAMAVLATAIGRRAKAELPTHKEPSPIWTCCILPQGSRKSDVFRVLTAPLADIEAELTESWREDWLRWKAEAELAEANIQRIKNEAKKKGADRRVLATELKEEKRVLEAEPVKPCIYLTDTTTEALRKTLAEQGSIGLLSAEGASLLESFGRYNGGNRGADMALFLSAHAGDADKGGRVSGTHGVREALASMGITAQPDVLQTIGRDRMARGRGLIDRFLFLIPEDPRGSRTYRNQQKVSPAIERKWAAIIRRIIDIEPQDPIPSVSLDEAAADAWLDFAQEIEDRQKPGGDLRGMAGFASKLAGAVGRIALACHFAQGRDVLSRIDAATMLRAIGMGLVLIDHARAATQLMGEDEATARARLVLEWLKRNSKETVKPRDVVAAGAGGCKTAEEARAACRKLEEHGYLAEDAGAEWRGTGRKPGERWRVNPVLSLDLLDLLGGSENEKSRMAA